MKKPYSITDVALAVIRVCLVLGIFISLFNFYIHTKQDPRIVVRIPPAETAAESQEYAAGSTGSETLSGAVHAEPTDISEPEETANIVKSQGTMSYDRISGEKAAPPVISTDAAESSPATAPPAETDHSAPQATAEIQDGASGLININTAPASELIRLNGIGEVKAAAIVEYRRANGAFRRIEDILNVSGIGEKTFEKIRDEITV